MAEKCVVEIQIAPRRIVSVTGSIRDVFAVVKGLKEEHDPQIRYHDPELGEPTCWQPTTSHTERSAA